MSKYALITGASGGLGIEFARIYANRGYNLVLVARNKQKLNQLKYKLEKHYPTSAIVFPCDLSEKDAACKIYDFLKSQHIRPYVLINNAGFGDFDYYAFSDWNKQYDMVQVNITALIQLTRLCLPDMIKHGGKILNVASIAAFEAGPCMSVYYASKSFVLSFTEALAVELKGTGVNVLALCPGPTQTGFESNANLGTSNLFKLPIVGNARDVASYGVKMLDRGHIIAVPGLLNQAMVLLADIAPHAISREVVYFLQKPRKMK